MSGSRYDWTGVLEMIAAGAFQADIARHVGCCTNSVATWCQRRGIVLERAVKTTTDDRYGCTNAEARRLNNGTPLNRSGHPAAFYRDHWRSAEKRGIGWEMTFPEWMAVWDGRLHLRGRHAGDLCMARIGDAGPYKVGNVKIITALENILESFVNVKRIRRAPYPPSPLKGLPGRVGRGQGYTYNARQIHRPYNVYVRGKFQGCFASKDEAIATYRAACGLGA